MVMRPQIQIKLPAFPSNILPLLLHTTVGRFPIDERFQIYSCGSEAAAAAASAVRSEQQMLFFQQQQARNYSFVGQARIHGDQSAS